MICGMCSASISLTRRLCARCLKSAHLVGCPSPRRECSCGFSDLFWADVETQYLAMPLVIELYAGLHGWGEGFTAEGYRCVGFDIVDMCALLGHQRPANCQLVIQDVLTLHGSQFKDAAVIVASPPCQEYSYRAMPWSRARSLPPPDNSLFEACFRIQREACEAAGRFVPLIVENVRGAQKWVGKAAWHFGSYYLWGDVPALMPIESAVKVGGFSWSDFGDADYKPKGFNVTAAQRIGTKFGGARGDDWFAHHNSESFAARAGVKNNGGSWFGVAPTNRERGQNPVKAGGDWFATYSQQKAAGTISPGRLYSSGSRKRRMASALIAKIPFPLAQHIARVFKPSEAELSVAGPKFTAVNVLLPGCDARTDDGRPHGTQPCSRERRMRKAKFGQPMPDSGKVNRVRSGSRVVRTEEVSGSGSRDRTIAECGAF